MKPKILITGGHGMLGTALRKDSYFDGITVYCPTRQALDLEKQNDVYIYMLETKPDCVFHLAARVGGVQDNSEHLADYYTQNIQINTNVLSAAFKSNANVLSVLSTCVYPDKAIFPLTENQIHNGPPHSSNYTYAYTKRMLEVQSRAYWDQYNAQFKTVIPNNIYGINDFYGFGCHVIPSLMRRFHEAKINSISDVKVWGDGTCLREFTFAPDVAKCLCFASEFYCENSPINIGNTEEISIKDLAELIQNVVGYNGEIRWDNSMPSGQTRKPSDTSKFKKLLKSCKKEIIFTTLEDGLTKTYDWFKNQYPNIRGF
jgi:GDP-L-fucose synthase